MQAPPPLEKKEPPKLIPDKSEPKTNLPEKKDTSPQAGISRSPLKQAVKNECEFQDDATPAPQGMGTGGKVLIAFAVLIFLGTLGFVGFLVYKNMDKFVQ